MYYRTTDKGRFGGVSDDLVPLRPPSNWIVISLYFILAWLLCSGLLWWRYKYVSDNLDKKIANVSDCIKYLESVKEGKTIETAALRKDDAVVKEALLTEAAEQKGAESSIESKAVKNDAVAANDVQDAAAAVPAEENQGRIASFEEYEKTSKIFEHDVFARFDFKDSADENTYSGKSHARLYVGRTHLDNQNLINLFPEARQNECEARIDSLKKLRNYYEKLREEEKKLHPLERYWQSVIVIFVMLFCFAACLYRLHPTFFFHTGHVFLSLLLIVLQFGGVMLAHRYVLTIQDRSPLHFIVALPLFAVPGLAIFLLGVRTSVCMSLLLASLTPLVQGGSLQFMLLPYSVICSVVAIIMYRYVTTWWGLIKCGFGVWGTLLVLSLLYAGFYGLFCEEWVNSGFRNYCDTCRNGWKECSLFELELIMIPLRNLPSFCSLTLWYASWNALITFLSMCLLPRVFELWLDVVSPIRLRKLSELTEENCPVLADLNSKAPGSSGHCKDVSDMATEAAKAIHANVLLAKVGGRFHDIGKMDDPLSFGENLYGKENPHASYTGIESAQRIRAHVTRGEKIGKEMGLPRPIRNIILCHHGNDLVGSFYNKALKEAKQNGDPVPDEKFFHYNAPLPHRKEAVLVMLADICEAASRYELHKVDVVNHDNVKALVDRWVMMKMQNGQFAAADMTLSELTIVSECYTTWLTQRFGARPSHNTEILQRRSGLQNKTDGVSGTAAQPLQASDGNGTSATETSSKAAQHEENAVVKNVGQEGSTADASPEMQVLQDDDK